MAQHISPMASVAANAVIGDDVRIGPFCVIGPNVKIGDGTILDSHVTLTGYTTIGQTNHLFPGVVIGAAPQDISYQNSPTQVIIGDNNVLRESVTVNRGTEKEDGITRLGNNCFLMAGTHIGHDCKVGDHVIMANNTMLGGHTHIHNNATLSGGVALHHYTTVGSYSFIAGMSRVLRDIPPYMLCDGITGNAVPKTVNIVALKRNNFQANRISALKAAFKILFRQKVTSDNAAKILTEENHMTPEVKCLLDFIENSAKGRNGRFRESRRAA
ncbi:MAG: acyl-ACP--UDP-N-acetylglucosamine O-acyltransferase [Pirellulales bacterium]|jgi:UDP-N-acetylglucosamine acyltransferase|nr:acyl-ACP--UDP-N-acetylglucosamine O-acyltransferase [Pirellulales bacterium]|tara:strand:- start:1382 stop:2194 length:813 start_codon:yes stop_codon:yes gene_type:complete